MTLELRLRKVIQLNTCFANQNAKFIALNLHALFLVPGEVNILRGIDVILFGIQVFFAKVL